ncbi:MAG: glycoside hydrolase family 95 protein, partial [candidate division KSB1 bacterium]|nr:glycoside hydrolase family 95 protein [candidate division KSB1 bacterium]
MRVFWLGVCLVAAAAAQECMPTQLQLWYRQPAEKWIEALPIGNGRLGAMVFGGFRRERLQLNEETLWSGSPVDNNNPEALKNLAKLRELLFRGEIEKAVKLAEKTLLGTPPNIRSYQTLGDLMLDFGEEGEPIEYRRQLDLVTGIASVEYELNGVRFRREVFASAPDNLVVIRLTADRPAALSFDLRLERSHDAKTLAVDQQLLLTGQIMDADDPKRGPGGPHMRFAARLQVLNQGGRVQAVENHLKIEKADAVTLLLTAATDYSRDLLSFNRNKSPNKICEQILEAAQRRPYDELKQRHIADHAAFMNRVTMTLGEAEPDTLPTDLRLRRVIAGQEDLGLVALYFQYGRYLLLGSSRTPGVLPANLQGIWNEHYNAPWGSDFHTNINLQMNYWPAEVTALPETVEPLTEFFLKLMTPGSRTAKSMYGARGWNMHHLTDPFGRTGLMDGIQWGTSPLAGAWMTLTFWEHYLFTQDEDYLRDKAWPLMKGAAEFIFDFLVPDPNGYLAAAPSMSPENAYILPEDGKAYQLTYSATIDIQIVRELLNACVAAAPVVGADQAFQERCRQTLAKLPPTRIGKDGTIMEWIEDYEEQEPGHRHISHLFGLHPATQITPQT